MQFELLSNMELESINGGSDLGVWIAGGCGMLIGQAIGGAIGTALFPGAGTVAGMTAGNWVGGMVGGGLAISGYHLFD